MMRSALLYVLFWSSMILMGLGTPVLDFFLASNEVPDVLRFECIINGLADPTARFEFYNNMSVLITQRNTDANQDYATYTITKDIIIRCIVGEEHSEDFMFAAIPTVSNQSISTDVFIDSYVMLMCPIPLPTVQSAYTIIWEQIEDSTPIIITNDSNRFMLSLDNQTLSIQISNSTDQMVFQCKLKLRQCSPLDPRRCQVVDVEGPFMEINVLETTLSPSSKMTTNDDILFMVTSEKINSQIPTNDDMLTSDRIDSQMKTNDTQIVTSGRVDSLTIAIATSVPISIMLLGMCTVIIILVTFQIKRKGTKNFEMDLRENISYTKDGCAQPLTDTNANTEVGKIEPSESYIKKFKDSKLLIPGRHIQLMHTIGQGEFGLVYQSYLTNWQGRTTPEVVAVKTLKSFFSARNIEDLIAESERMKKFDHPNIMSLIGVCIDVGEKPYIVMPFMENGSLLAYLKKERSHFTLTEDAGDELIKDTRRKLLSMCFQIAKGMSYLAKQKFIHRDLAARNCMIDDKFVIKVGDFGLAEEVYTTNYFRQEEAPSVKLPVKWMALESLLDGIFSEKTDVWSFGVTCWEIFNLGHTPYPAIDPFALVRFLQNGGRLEKPNNDCCNDQIYNLVTRCWEESPKKRPCFEDLVCEINSLLEGVAGYLELSAFFGKLGL